MSALEPTSSTTQSTTGSTLQRKGAEMGKDQFLKLFVAQLQHQDPMNPMEDSEFMGQMASFSTLEQTTNMAKANERIASSLALSQSVSLIGRTVSWTDDAGATHSGIVERVSTTKEGAARLTVGGNADVDPAKITQVA